MLGAGTIINPLIKLVTTVAILAAVYFFILKPVLDTTEDSFNAFDDTFEGFGDLPANIKGEIDDALEATGGAPTLEDCIRRAINAGPDADRVKARTDRCIDRFGS